ncbi:MAG: Rpn family recombination-promoting nuclease/putative transposase [Lachnospiraceae bacterium]|nr:Rpn family recombination-promoting nuclease/putative transposase [Lachnospiraceae bacterium]
MTEDTNRALEEYRDIVKKLKKDQNVAILGIEHQSEQSFQMPFRVMEMDFLSYARQVRVIMERNKKVMKAGKDSKEDSDLNATQPKGFIAVSESVLPDRSLYPRPNNGEYLDRFYQSDQIAPCITLVIYWGAEPWQGPKGLSEMFGKNSMASYAKDYPMYLLEVRQIPDMELASYGKELRAVFGFVKYARDKLSLQRFLTQNEEDFSELSGIVLDAIAELTHSPELKKLRSTQYAIEMEGGNYNMCQALREWMEDERREGIEEGRKEGIKEERINTERERRRADAAEQELRILKVQFGLV